MMSDCEFLFIFSDFWNDSKSAHNLMLLMMKRNSCRVSSRWLPLHHFKRCENSLNCLWKKFFEKSRLIYCHWVGCAENFILLNILLSLWVFFNILTWTWHSLAAFEPSAKTYLTPSHQSTVASRQSVLDQLHISPQPFPISLAKTPFASSCSCQKFL